MSAVLAACMFMVIAPSAMSVENNNSVEPSMSLVIGADQPAKPSAVQQDGYKKAIKSIENVGLKIIVDNLNKIVSGLNDNFSLLDNKVKIEPFTGNDRGALINQISDCIGKCSKALSFDGKNDPINTYASIQSKMSALNMYKLALANFEIASLFINAHKIDNIMNSSIQKESDLHAKYKDTFGDTSITDRINSLFNKSEVSQKAISDFVEKIVSFLENAKNNESGGALQKQYQYFRRVSELMQSYAKPKEYCRWISEKEMESIDAVFAAIPNNSSLAFLLAESVTKHLEHVLSNLSQRVINHLNRLKTKLDNEIKLDETVSGDLVIQRNLIEGRVLLVSALNDKAEKAAEKDVHIVNTAEISTSIASLKSALAMYADTDLLMRQTEEMLGQHYGYLIQDKGIDYNLLADRFIARFSKYFGEEAAKTFLSPGNDKNIRAFFKTLGDQDGKVQGSKITIDNISAILAKISYHSKNEEWMKNAAMTRMKNHLIKFAKEQLYPYSIDNSWQEAQSKSAINSIFNFFSKAGHAIATPVKKMLSQEKQQELLTKKEKKAYEKVKTREEEADKFYASGAYKTKYAKDLLVDSDNILGGKIVLKPYDKPNDGGEYMTRNERDALIKYLESLPESERTEAFAKVKKYTGRAVEVIDGRTDNHLFRRGINHLKSAENRTIPVSYHNYNKGKYSSARARNK